MMNSFFIHYLLSCSLLLHTCSYPHFTIYTSLEPKRHSVLKFHITLTLVTLKVFFAINRVLALTYSFYVDFIFMTMRDTSSSLFHSNKYDSPTTRSFSGAYILQITRAIMLKWRSKKWMYKNLKNAIFCFTYRLLTVNSNINCLQFPTDWK